MTRHEMGCKASNDCSPLFRDHLPAGLETTGAAGEVKTPFDCHERMLVIDCPSRVMSLDRGFLG